MQIITVRFTSSWRTCCQIMSSLLGKFLSSQIIKAFLSCKTPGAKSFCELTLFYITEIIIGTYVLQATICQASIVQMIIIYTTLRLRCAANLTKDLTLSRHVTMRMFRRVLTGINKAGCHVHKLVIIFLVCIDPAATSCIASRL